MNFSTHGARRSDAIRFAVRDNFYFPLAINVEDISFFEVVLSPQGIATLPLRRKEWLTRVPRLYINKEGIHAYDY